MAHTPGPWHWNESHSAIYNGTKDENGHYSHCEQVFPFYNEDAKSPKGKEHADNARLMIAAPDLLASLQSCLELLTSNSNVAYFFSQQGEQATFHAAVNAARKALQPLK